ncbi:unnamed protein product [Adineta ricciae]|uniref:G-protein coupled receptors family 1 profile domain-containing protein n=1 Tax=Adineta ricciae TaxID=249248 RepID=A0A814K0U2_ADIRI|nr:unnamed protein product [Adineta ricciae]
MSLNINVNTTRISYYQYTTSVDANRIKFGVFLTLQLISIPCFLWLFYQFLRQRQLRQLHHHVILLLLLVSFLFVIIVLPITESYMYFSHIYPEVQQFCSFWNWLQYSLNIVNCFLMAFASVERNWLVFYPQLVRSQRGKFFFHYCPLVFCILYPSVFYAAAIFIHKCTFYYDYSQLLCKWPCYFYNLKWSSVDLFFNNYVPLIIIPSFCAVLYIRIYVQKRKMKQQAFKWVRDKKMIIQLWAISSLYLCMWLPTQLSGLINTYWDQYFLLQAQIDYIYLFPYLIHLIYPFIILMTYHKEMLTCKKAAPQGTFEQK